MEPGSRAAQSCEAQVNYYRTNGSNPPTRAQRPGSSQEIQTLQARPRELAMQPTTYPPHCQLSTSSPSISEKWASDVASGNDRLRAQAAVHMSLVGIGFLFTRSAYLTRAKSIATGLSQGMRLHLSAKSWSKRKPIAGSREHNAPYASSATTGYGMNAVSTALNRLTTDVLPRMTSTHTSVSSA